MPLRAPHERSRNPRTGRMEITRTNPTQIYHEHSGNRTYYWQNGEFYLSPTGDPVDPGKVPAAFRELCEQIDFVQENRRVCRHCSQLFPESKYAEHLELEMARMADQMADHRAFTSQDDAAEDMIPSAPARRKKPKKRGRPPKARPPMTIKADTDGSGSLDRVATG